MLQKSTTQVALFNKGVSLNNKVVKLYLCNTEYNNYRHSIIEHKITSNRKNTVDVECVALKDILHRNPDIDCIKMDIEGAEIELIENVDLWITPNIKKLVFEWSFDFNTSTTFFLKCMKGLEKHFKLVSFRKLPHTKEGVLKEHHLHYPQCHNVFCMN